MSICKYPGCTKERLHKSSHAKYCAEHKIIAQKEANARRNIKRNAEHVTQEVKAKIVDYVCDMPIFAPPESMHEITKRMRENGGTYYPQSYKPDPPTPKVHVSIWG